MWPRIPSLEVLMLVATIAPAELVRVATSFSRAGSDAAVLARRGRWGVPAAYLLTTCVALGLAGLGGFLPPLRLGLPALFWLPLAVGVGGAVIAVELFIGVLPRLGQGWRRLRFGVNWTGTTTSVGQLVSILVIALAEELLYRGLWIGTLTSRLQVGSVVAVLLTALAYGCGHLFFGGLAVAQKIVTGLVFGWLFVVSGSLLTPLLAHLSQNCLVYGIATKQMARQ